MALKEPKYKLTYVLTLRTTLNFIFDSEIECQNHIDNSFKNGIDINISDITATNGVSKRHYPKSRIRETQIKQTRDY